MPLPFGLNSCRPLAAWLSLGLVYLQEQIKNTLKSNWPKIFTGFIQVRGSPL